MKKCTKCKKEKALSDFHRSKISKHGLYSHCKECHREDMKAYYEKRKLEGPKVFKENKKCLKCKEIKPINHFGKKTQSIDGKHQYCKECWREYVYERI